VGSGEEVINGNAAGDDIQVGFPRKHERPAEDGEADVGMAAKEAAWGRRGSSYWFGSNDLVRGDR